MRSKTVDHINSPGACEFVDATMEARESTCFTGVVAPGVAKVGLVFPRVSAGAGLIWKSNHEKARNRSTGCFSLQARAAIRGVRSQNAHACSESLARARFSAKTLQKIGAQTCAEKATLCTKRLGQFGATLLLCGVAATCRHGRAQQSYCRSPAMRNCS